MLKNQLRVLVRLYVRKDLKDILEVETDSFPEPWSLKDILAAFKYQKCECLIAEARDRVVGYIFYETSGKDSTLQIANLAVSPLHRRRGVATTLLGEVEKRLRPSTTTLLVDEANLPCQLLLRYNGFQCVSVLRNLYPDGNSGYLFQR